MSNPIENRSGGFIPPEYYLAPELVAYLSEPPSARGRFKLPAYALNAILAGLLAACAPGRAAENPTPGAFPPAIGVAATPTTEPSPTATNTPEPTATPTPEVKTFDCGILSPEACATGKYVRWILASSTVIDGIAFNFSKGVEFKIMEDSQVAATQRGEGFGYRITAVNKDTGETLNIMGDVTPKEGLSNVGDNLSAKSIIAKSNDSGSIVFAGSNVRQVIYYSSNEKLRSIFPELTKVEPEVIFRADRLEITPSDLTFFGVPLPPTPTPKNN